MTILIASVSSDNISLMSFWYTRFIIETHLGDTFVLHFISIIVCIKNIFGILRKTFFCYNQVMSMCYDRWSRSQLCLLSSGVLNFPFLSVKILIVLVARMVPHMTRTSVLFIDVTQMISYNNYSEHDKTWDFPLVKHMKAFNPKTISWPSFKGLNI